MIKKWAQMEPSVLDLLIQYGMEFSLVEMWIYMAKIEASPVPALLGVAMAFWHDRSLMGLGTFQDRYCLLDVIDGNLFFVQGERSAWSLMQLLPKIEHDIAIYGCIVQGHVYFCPLVVPLYIR